jgi:hypothetical protein
VALSQVDTPPGQFGSCGARICGQKLAPRGGTVGQFLSRDLVASLLVDCEGCHGFASRASA